MQHPSLRKIGKRTLQIGLPVAIAAFFLYKVHDYNWQILTADASRWNYWLLAVSFLGFILQELSFGLIWQSVLKRLGYRLALRPCLRSEMRPRRPADRTAAARSIFVITATSALLKIVGYLRGLSSPSVTEVSTRRRFSPRS